MKTIAAFTGPLMPDLPDRDNPGVVRAENCLPLAKSFEPFRAHVADMDALPSACLGARAVQDYVLETFSYAGTATNIYQRVGDSWSSVGSGYTAMTWEFAAFNDNVYAANGFDLLQVSPIQAVSAFVDDTSTTPADVPAPKHIGIARNFIITGNLPSNPRLVQWSAVGGGDWTNDGSNQAGKQVLQEGGAITRVIGGEYATIFTEHSIYVMRFVGGALIWQFDEVQPGRGTLSGGSVTQIGNEIYYLGDDGFYVFNGITSRPIGSTTMNQTFIDDYDSTKPDAISSLIDLDNTLVYWSYPGSGNTGIANKIMIYNYATDRWAGPVHVEVERLAYSQLPSILSDSFPGAPVISDTIFDLSDATKFKGGKPEVTAFNNTHTHGTFTGDSLIAVVESGEFAMNIGGKALLRSVRALVDGNNLAIGVSVGTRNSASGPVTYIGPKAAYAETGKAKFRANARFHRIVLTVSGDYTHIFGAEPESVGTSAR